MRLDFRSGFYGGLSCAVLIGLYLVWLWQPERQVRLHTRHLISEIEQKDWPAVRAFIAEDYHDDWGHDREELLHRIREVVRYTRNFQISWNQERIELERQRGTWSATIKVEGEGDVVGMIKERLNAVATPFELDWRRMSARPWDWKLTLVTNPGLSIPALPIE